MSRRRRILIIEDDADVADVLRDLIADDGHQVHVAKNGRVALEHIACGDYDLIFCDLHMPELDGMAFCGELERQRPELLKHLIIVSEYLADHRADEFLARMKLPAIGKPFDPADIRRAVMEY